MYTYIQINTSAGPKTRANPRGRGKSSKMRCKMDKGIMPE